MSQSELNPDGHKGSTILPTRRDLAFAYAASLAIAGVLAGAVIVGVWYPAVIYPTRDVLRSSLPADLVNLVGLPILLVSMWLARRGSLAGLLLWPGALFYLLYHDLVYLFSQQVNLLFLLHLIQTALNLYAMIGLVAAIDGEAVHERLTGAVPERTSGAILAALGALFFLWATVVIIRATFHRAPVTTPELALRVTDCLMSPAWIIGGVLLWRRRPLGYVASLGLLFQASMLFLGLIVLFVLQWLISSAPFRSGDVAVVFAMGLMCFVPFGLFLRGTARKE